MSKIPKLRFKEFSGEWEENILGNYVEYISSGKTKEKVEIGTYKVYGSTGVIGYTEVPDYAGEHILIARVGANAGTVNVTNEKCGISDNTLAIKYKEKLCYKFSYYQLKRYDLNRLIFGSGQPLITGGQLKSLKLKFPSKVEQEKIASLFSLIDDKISLQGEKVEALKDYKKGMMQKIFSRELRFKDYEGRDYPEWEEKKLNELGDFLKGSTLSKSHLTNNGKPCILYGELYTKYGEVINNIVSRTDLEDDRLILGYSNDVLIPSSGETAIDIATASCLLKDDVILGGDLNVFRSSKLNGVFLSYQLNNTKKNEISKLAQGASVVHLYNNQLAKLKVDIPCIDEQNKIADFLHNIDRKIEKEQDKLNYLNEYKKGLLQQMFV